MSNLNNKSIKVCRENQKDFLNEYDFLYKELMQRLIRLVFPRRNSFKKTPLQDSKYQLRDSILYRAGSIRFHLKLLFFIKRSIEKEFSSDLEGTLEGSNDIPLMVQGTENLMQIFDDIVFHTCSMFDYLGNLIGLLYYGQNKMKLKWNGVLDSIKDKNNKLSITSIAPICEQIHKELVNPLFKYRGRLIHHKKDSARGSQKISFNKGFVNIHFDVGFPTMLKNSSKIKCLEDTKFKKQEEANIIEIAIILSLESIKSTIEIIKNISPNPTIK